MKGVRLIPIAAAAWVLFLCMPGSTAFSQPVLTLDNIIVRWPTIECVFIAECNGTKVSAQRQDMQLWENGNKIENFQLWCPDPGIRCAISSVLVFDCSSSMAGSGITGAKLAGHAFVNKMDGNVDEASVIFFSTIPTVFQQMTTVKPMLHSAVDAMPAGGMSGVWDGIYAGVIELINNGVNQCRSVVVLADGEDNVSTRTPSQIIALAIRHRIPVFVVLYGNTPVALEMEAVAQQTGGKFFQTPNAGALAQIFEQIYDLTQSSVFNCVVTYEATCPDGSDRTVRLELGNLCAGSDTASMVYKAPLDSSLFTTADISLESVGGLKDADVRMPVRLVTPLQNATMHPFGLRLLFDTSRIRLVDAVAPAGSLLDGSGFTVTPNANGALIETGDTNVVSGPGLLFDLVFHTSAKDTGCADIRGSTSWFTAGCLLPRVNATTLCIFPDRPVVSCTPGLVPTVLWDKASGKYLPEQLPIQIHFTNNGAVDALLTHVRIRYEENDVALAAPVQDTVFYAGAAIQATKTTSFAWDVAPLPRATAINTRICIVAAFANHSEVSCCMVITIPSALPTLSCHLSLPTIVADTLGQQYAPMPFAITMTVRNDGGEASDSVRATLALPPGLEPAFPDAPSTLTKLITPPILTPGASGQAVWTVQHARTAVDKAYSFDAIAVAANTDTTTCTADVVIPGLPELFHASITKIGALRFCEGSYCELDAGAGYQWYRWSSGERQQRIRASASGEYFCTMLAPDGSFFVTDTVTVTVIPAPATPIVSRSGDVLSSTIAHRYQWFKDGQPLSGATGQNLTVTSTGSYTVRIETVDSCSATSDPFVVTVLSTEIPAQISSFDVWPEPNDGVLRVRLRTEVPVRTSIVVRTVLGQEIARHESSRSATEYEQVIDLGSAPAGVYFLHVTSGAATFVRAVVRKGR